MPKISSVTPELGFPQLHCAHKYVAIGSDRLGNGFVGGRRLGRSEALCRLPTKGFSLMRLSRATGLFRSYCWDVRNGKYVPHSRHWEAFRGLIGKGPETEPCQNRQSEEVHIPRLRASERQTERAGSTLIMRFSVDEWSDHSGLCALSQRGSSPRCSRRSRTVRLARTSQHRMATPDRIAGTG